jgi:hypothetical protein
VYRLETTELSLWNGGLMNSQVNAKKPVLTVIILIFLVLALGIGGLVYKNLVAS